MIHEFLALVASSQGVAVTASSPPPPVIVSLEAAQPSGVVTASPIAAVGRIPVVVQANDFARVRVRIAAVNRVLFDDEMRVGRSAGANYSESRTEAPAINCSSDRYYSGGERDSLNLQLYYRDDPQTGPAISVNVTWQRPTATTTCPSEGSRSVSLAQTVPLAPGESETIRGDAGLVVTLSRR